MIPRPIDTITFNARFIQTNAEALPNGPSKSCRGELWREGSRVITHLRRDLQHASTERQQASASPSQRSRHAPSAALVLATISDLLDRQRRSPTLAPFAPSLASLPRAVLPFQPDELGMRTEQHTRSHPDPGQTVGDEVDTTGDTQ